MYGIMPLGNVGEYSYKWKHPTEGEAVDAAGALSRSRNVNVIVFKIIGGYKRVSIYEDIADGIDAETEDQR